MFENILASMMGWGSTDNIGRTAVSDFIVSTINTNDCGHETAVLGQSTCCVERYDSKEDAEVGHERWVKRLAAHPGGPFQVAAFNSWGDEKTIEDIEPLSAEDMTYLCARQSTDVYSEEEGEST